VNRNSGLQHTSIQRLGGPVVRGRVNELHLFTASCNTCTTEKTIDGGGMTREGIVAAFRTAGWRIRAGAWVCPEHVGHHKGDRNADD
jgi:hypothetical protein